MFQQAAKLIFSNIRFKCDKIKPTCGTCTKANIKCEYTGLDLVESTLQQQISEDQIDFHRYGKILLKDGPLSFFTIVSLDPFVKCVLHVVKDNKRLPMKIRDELDRGKRKKSLIPSNELFESIKPLISNTFVVWSLVDHFFESELFNTCSFFQRDDFNKNLINFIGPKSYPAVRSRIDGPYDFIFIGTLLVILRISSWSFYNAGYETEFMPFTVESIDLAKQCYEEVRYSYHHYRTQLLQFILILDFYRTNCAEDLDYVEGFENSANYILAQRLAINLGLNFETNDEHLKRLWYHLVELDTNQFLKDGNCSFLIDDKSYSTPFPQEPNDATIYIRERFKVRELIKPLAMMITDVGLKPSIKELNLGLEKLEQYLIDLDLNFILTLPNKVEKCAKFLNFLDISSLVYMVLYHIFLHYTGIDTQKAFETLARLLSISNPVLHVTHFLDSTKDHFYNLQQQFGPSFLIIPKILITLHKFLQLQISLIGRTNYILPKAKIDVSFEEIKRISFQNSRVIIANFGRISDKYFYAKRMNMIQTVLFVNTFGTTSESPVAPNYIKLLDNEPRVVSSKVLTELVELNLQAQASASADQGLVDFPENDLLDVMLDQESIEQLEQMLNAQSFLY